MAFINKYEQSVSYECNELIEDVKEDIKEHGGQALVDVLVKDSDGACIYTAYDLVSGKRKTVLRYAAEDGDNVKRMTLSTLLLLLEEQNKIF